MPSSSNRPGSGTDRKRFSLTGGKKSKSPPKATKGSSGGADSVKAQEQDTGDERKSVIIDLSGGGGRSSMIDDRRAAVRAGHDMTEMTEEELNKDLCPKSEEEQAFISSAIQKSEFLEGVSGEQLAIMLRGFTKLEAKNGETIITQGEKGDNFYLVASGTFEATLKQKGTEVVAKYVAGDLFGELALLYNAPRAATVVCTTGGTLWSLDRTRFRHVMVHTGTAAHASKSERFLKSVSLTSALTNEQRSRLADAMEELTYKDEQMMVKMGDVADALFFIKSGEVSCHGADAKHEIMRMKTGDCFGESCLEPTPEDALRKLNVVAVGPVTALKLSAQAFKEQLGSLKDVVNKNFKRKVLQGIEIESTHVFSQLSPNAQDALVDKLKEVHYKPGSICIKQGNKNDTFFIIKSGTCTVLESKNGSENELATLTNGSYFGERALLRSEPAVATIKAAGDKDLEVYTCDRNTFSSIIGSAGSLQELIDKEIAHRDEARAKDEEKPKFKDLDVKQILGVGSFGRVKLVIHKPTKQVYALKCMRKAQVIAMKQDKHTVNEKNILAKMRHPFVLQLVQTYQDPGELYMLMQLALGGELFSLLGKQAPLKDWPAKFYVSSVVAMFSYMHALKFVYRDLKPENLLLDADGYLKLIDFGFAKELSDKTFTLCGTPEYLAPEIILNKGHSFGADWWCVGILTFECLTGKSPFVHDDHGEMYRRIVKRKLNWPSNIQGEARDFIDKLLNIDPLRRLGANINVPAGQDVRKHNWFVNEVVNKQKFDFAALEAKKYPAPFVPKIRSPTDASAFDPYGEDDGKLNYPEEVRDREKFAGFADEWV